MNICKTKWNFVGESGNQHEPVQVKNVKNGNFPHFSLHIPNFSDLFQAFFLETDMTSKNIFLIFFGRKSAKIGNLRAKNVDFSKSWPEKISKIQNFQKSS